jgi:hypothetical protein
MEQGPHEMRDRRRETARDNAEDSQVCGRGICGAANHPRQGVALRQGRDGHELAQDEGQAVRVVAVSDAKPSLLSFAAINGIPVKNYTDMAAPKARVPSAPKPAEVPELVM